MYTPPQLLRPTSPAPCVGHRPKSRDQLGGTIAPPFVKRLMKNSFLHYKSCLSRRVKNSSQARTRHSRVEIDGPTDRSIGDTRQLSKIAELLDDYAAWRGTAAGSRAATAGSRGACRTGLLTRVALLGGLGDAGVQ